MDFTKILHADEEIHQKVDIADIFSKRVKILVPVKQNCIFCNGITYNTCDCIDGIKYRESKGTIKIVHCNCNKIEICYRCKSSGEMIVKEPVYVQLSSLLPFSIKHHDKTYAIYIGANPPYYIENHRLHYKITLTLSEMICGFRKKLVHPNHPNTLIIWPRGSMFHLTNKYILPGAGFAGDDLFITFDVKYPDSLGHVPPKEPFSWRNIERFLGRIDFEQISPKDIVFIDLNTLDYVPL